MYGLNKEGKSIKMKQLNIWMLILLLATIDSAKSASAFEEISMDSLATPSSSILVTLSSEEYASELLNISSVEEDGDKPYVYEEMKAFIDEIPQEKRGNIVKKSFLLIHHRMRSYDILETLMYVSSIPEDERNSIIDNAALLINENIERFYIRCITSFIGEDVPPADRSVFAKSTRLLINAETEGSNIRGIMASMLHTTLPEERYSLAKSTSLVTKPDMDDWDILSVMACIQSIFPENERDMRARRVHYRLRAVADLGISDFPSKEEICELLGFAMGTELPFSPEATEKQKDQVVTREKKLRQEDENWDRRRILLFFRYASKISE